ncbi:twin-arginine translocation signal domain-containing protein [Rhizobium sullae]|uniref:twin-arginine translocation signal domain-containing protein n=1 Tax=Rhizobium sullae TaxID=50338 RepID=UPI00117AD5D9|nr:twin-arginine translocation signal domain-containing protein [Rhizobium sullae]
MKKKRGEVERDQTECGPGQSVSRRKFLKATMTGVAIAGAAGLSGCLTGQPVARGAGTTPKSVARYQDRPNKGRRCGGCTHFLEPNACEVVAGEISPNGWCRFHEPRPA